MARRVVKRTKRLQQRRRATKPSAPRKPQAEYVPKGSDPLLKCPKCKVWSARVDYCSNCRVPRRIDGER